MFDLRRGLVLRCYFAVYHLLHVIDAVIFFVFLSLIELRLGNGFYYNFILPYEFGGYLE